MEEKRQNKLHILIIVLGSIFILLSVFHSYFWFDEGYSIAISKHSFTDIWNIGAGDVHPVLYYFFLHIIYLIFGKNILIYRLFSCIPIIILGVLGYTHIRKDFGSKMGILFTLFNFILPVIVVYANQIRMYSWAYFMVSILTMYVYRTYKNGLSKKNIIIIFITSICSMYLHYYGLMTTGILDLFLFIYFVIKKDKKSSITLLIMGILLISCYIPWMLKLISQMEYVSEGYWIGFTFPKTLVELSSFMFLGDKVNDKTFGFFHYVVFVLVIELFIYIGIKLYQYKKNKIDIKPAILAISIYLSVIIASLLITLILHTSILYYRYLFIITGLFIFTLSFVLVREENTIVRNGIILIILGLSIYNNINTCLENYDSSNKDAYNYIKENIRNSDTLILNDIGSGSVVSELTNNNGYFYNVYGWAIDEAYLAYGPNLKTVSTDDFIKGTYGRIILVGIEDDVYNKYFNNDNYKLIEEVSLNTKYYEYTFYIKTIERVN